MKKAVKIILISFMSVIFMLGLFYLGLAYYYEDGFLFGTYINDIYCTGKTVEEVNDELNDRYEYEGLTVEGLDGQYFLSKDDLSLSYDFQKPLNYFIQQQIPVLWVKNLFAGDSYYVTPEIHFDRDSLFEYCQDHIFKDAVKTDRSVAIGINQKGFDLFDSKENSLDEDKTFEAVCDAVCSGKDRINLKEEGCYCHEKLTSQEQELVQFYELLKQFQSKKAVFHFGDETVQMRPAMLAKMLQCYPYFKDRKTVLPGDYKEDFFETVKTKDGPVQVPALNSEAVRKEFSDFAKPYNTYGFHVFTTHDNRTVEIKGGTYGNQIDISEECRRLSEFLKSYETEYDREPVYRKKARYQGKDDIGPTYVEVDMGMQKMFYYEDGILRIETDVVTGKNKCTAEGVNFIYGKQKNRVLHGPNYDSPVKYWMPVNKGVGIHDAGWRNKFGGSIYLKSGSHGCINTPFDDVKELYQRAEIGTPVVMYYGEK